MRCDGREARVPSGRSQVLEIVTRIPSDIQPIGEGDTYKFGSNFHLASDVDQKSYDGRATEVNKAFSFFCMTMVLKHFLAREQDKEKTAH